MYCVQGDHTQSLSYLSKCVQDHALNHALHFSEASLMVYTATTRHRGAHACGEDMWWAIEVVVPSTCTQTRPKVQSPFLCLLLQGRSLRWLQTNFMRPWEMMTNITWTLKGTITLPTAHCHNRSLQRIEGGQRATAKHKWVHFVLVFRLWAFSIPFELKQLAFKWKVHGNDEVQQSRLSANIF